MIGRDWNRFGTMSRRNFSVYLRAVWSIKYDARDETIQYRMNDLNIACREGIVFG